MTLFSCAAFCVSNPSSDENWQCCLLLDICSLQGFDNISVFRYACTYVLGFTHTYTLTAIFWIIYICHATISWLACVHMCICIHTTCSYDLTTVKYPGGTYGHCYIFHDPFASFLHTAAPVTLIIGATYTHIMTFSTLLW